MRIFTCVYQFLDRGLCTIICESALKRKFRVNAAVPQHTHTHLMTALTSPDAFKCPDTEIIVLVSGALGMSGL